MKRLKKILKRNCFPVFIYGCISFVLAAFLTAGGAFGGRDAQNFSGVSFFSLGAVVALVAALTVAGKRAYCKLKEERNRFYKASITDPLTGLNTFTNTIELGKVALEKGDDLLLVLLDLDNFKNVNATYGHNIGNSILKQFARQLRALWGEAAIIGRLCGDEYIAILTNVEGRRAAVTEQLEALKSREYTADPDLAPVQVEFSYGMASSGPEQKANIEELVELADKEMYAYKLARRTKQTTYKFNAEMPEDFRDILTVLSQKDMYTFLHSLYVAQYGAALARRIGLDEQAVENIRLAGWLHDIGKIAVPNEILRKPGKLNQLEYQAIQNHVKYGYNLLHAFAIPEAVRNAICQHHERYDGKGYPSKLKGEDISLSGRILAIVDAYSAMTIKRVYRRYQFSTDDALREILRGSGTQFDAALVKQFAQLIETERGENEERQTG